MKGIFEKVKGFMNDESGLTIVEYAVAGGLIAAGAVTAFNLLGINVDRVIRLINGELDGVQ